MPLSEEVLSTIRNLRKKHNYSLEQVGKAIGYETGKGYYDLESGKTEIKLEHLEKLSKFYGIPITYFLKIE